MGFRFLPRSLLSRSSCAWLAALLALLVCLSSGPGAASDAADWSSLPPSVARSLHWNRRDVPRFPEDADSLLDVHRWPKTRIFDRQEYFLRFSAADHDMVRPDIETYQQILPGWSYGARYSRPRGDGTWTLGRGPRYYWRSDGMLYERAWVDGEDAWVKGTYRVWGYDSSGVLVHYCFRSPKDGQIDEYFDVPDGALIAVLVHSRGYWMGRSVDGREMFRLLNEHRERGGRP